MDPPAALIDDRPRSLVDRVDSIRDAFDARHARLTLPGLVASTGLPKTTVHRTVRKMMSLGWLECHEGRYGIGTGLFERTAVSITAPANRLVFLQLAPAVRDTAQLASRAAADRLGPAGGRSPLRSVSPHSEERGRIT